MSGYKTHWDWLHEKHDFPIYMIEAYPEIPGAVRYPLESASEVYHGLGRNVFTSTFDFMIALAIAEKYERVYIFGFEMATSTDGGAASSTPLVIEGHADVPAACTVVDTDGAPHE